MTSVGAAGVVAGAAGTAAIASVGCGVGAGAAASSARASSANWIFTSPIWVSPSARPTPVGSIAYSEGITTVTRSTQAMIAAVIVERSSCAVDGSSLRVGSLVLNIERIP